MGFQEYAESARSRVRMPQADRRLLLGILVVGLIVAAFAIARFAGALVPAGAGEEAGEGGLVIEAEEPSEPQALEACVHVVGCVVEPGLKRLPSDARIADAIEAAGGFAEDADQAAVNLAEAVEDGMQIVVPSASDAVAQGEPGQASGGAASASASDGRVNINTATLSDLMGLDGIGEAKAQKIIAYREANGRFASVDELVNVSGIGQKTLEALRASICV